MDRSPPGELGLGRTTGVFMLLFLRMMIRWCASFWSRGVLLLLWFPFTTSSIAHTWVTRLKVMEVAILLSREIGQRTRWQCLRVRVQRLLVLPLVCSQLLQWSSQALCTHTFPLLSRVPFAHRPKVSSFLHRSIIPSKHVAPLYHFNINNNHSNPAPGLDTNSSSIVNRAFLQCARDL